MENVYHTASCVGKSRSNDGAPGPSPLGTGDGTRTFLVPPIRNWSKLGRLAPAPITPSTQMMVAGGPGLDDTFHPNEGAPGPSPLGTGDGSKPGSFTFSPSVVSTVAATSRLPGPRIFLKMCGYAEYFLFLAQTGCIARLRPDENVSSCHGSFCQGCDRSIPTGAPLLPRNSSFFFSGDSPLASMESMRFTDGLRNLSINRTPEIRARSGINAAKLRHCPTPKSSVWSRHGAIKLKG